LYSELRNQDQFVSVLLEILSLSFSISYQHLSLSLDESKGNIEFSYMTWKASDITSKHNPW